MTEAEGCAYIFNSRLPCHADESHAVHHGAWGGPEDNHTFVPGGPPVPSYRARIEADHRRELAKMVRGLRYAGNEPVGFRVAVRAVLSLIEERR